MKIINLSQGKYAIVDDDMFNSLSEYKWYVRKDKGNYYAQRNLWISPGKRKTVMMHHYIIGYPINGYVTDHINGNGLDNRIQNLRIVSNRLNTLNSKKKNNCRASSKYSGVYLNKKFKRWYASILIGKEKCFLGSYEKEQDAAEIYIKKLMEVEQCHTQTWKLNQPAVNICE